MGNKWDQVRKHIPDIPRFRSLLLKEDDGAIYISMKLVEQYELSNSFLYQRFGWRPKTAKKKDLIRRDLIKEIESRSGYSFNVFKERIKDNAYDALLILKEIASDYKIPPNLLVSVGLSKYDLKRNADDGIPKPYNRKGVTKRNV